MSALLNLKVLTNPMDFDIGFAGIAYSRKRIILVVFSKNNAVKKYEQCHSLVSAQRAFAKFFPRGKGKKPVWSTEKMEYFAGTGRSLFINGDGLGGVKKLDQIMKGSDYDKDKYYGTFSETCFDHKR